METIYKEVESRVKPVTVEIDRDYDTVYLRKNVEERTKTEESTKELITYFHYQEAQISVAEYESLELVKAVADSVTIRHESDIIDDYTLKLIEEGSL